MLKIILALPIVLSFLTLPVWAASAIQLKMNLTTGKGKEAAEANTVFSISDLGLRSISKEGKVHVVYDKKAASLLSLSKKSYTTAADIAEGLGPMAGLMTQLIPQFSFTETKEIMKARGWSCQKFLIFQDGQEAGYLCAAKMKDLGFNAAEIKTVKDGFKSLGEIQKILGNPIFQVAADLANKHDAFTIDMKAHTKIAILGQEKESDLTNQLISAERINVPASDFAVPKDYKHVTKVADIMGMMK